MRFRPESLLLALAAAVTTTPTYAATQAQLLDVQQRLQRAAAPWCERLSTRDADGLKRCTIKATPAAVPGLVNAMSAFGDVWVTDEMLPHLSEGDLALVMGHEFAHLLLGHALQRLRDSDPANAVRRALLTLLESNSVPPHDDAPTQAVQQELDADELGLYLAGLAGYPVREIATFWAQRAQALHSSTISSPKPERTHPPRQARAAGLERAAAEFCERLASGRPLMPDPAWLQPRHEADVDLLREQQSRVGYALTCRPAPSP